MPNKCGVVNCKGNYNAANKCRLFKVPNSACIPLLKAENMRGEHNVCLFLTITVNLHSLYSLVMKTQIYFAIDIEIIKLSYL